MIDGRLRQVSAVLIALGLGIGVVAAVLVPVHAVEAPRAYVLTKGHIDLFEVTYDAGAKGLRLRVKDDTRLYDPDPVYRDPADVSIGIDGEIAAVDTSRASSDFEFLRVDGNTIYQLPQAQNLNLPWPGWSTERLVGTLPEGLALPQDGQPVRLAVDVEGPGHVFTWQTGAFGEVQNRYIDTVDPAADVIPVDRNAHVHTNWAFTKPGDYELTVTPTATTASGGTLTGDRAVYHVHVEARDATPAPAPVATDVRATAVRQMYGRSARLAVTVAPRATGTVRVRAGSRTTSGTLSGGRAVVTVPAKALAPGRRSVTITYPGVVGDFAPARGTATVNVVKATPRVTVRAVKKVKRGKVAVVRVSVGATGVRPSGKVIVKLAGRTKAVKLNRSGKATVRIPIRRSVTPKWYVASLTYGGDRYVATAKPKKVRVRVSR